MVVLNANPPNFKKIVKTFPGASRRGVIFSYGSRIYAPQSVGVPPALIRHEGVHGDRQLAMGIEVWWDRYLVDAQFRFDEELLAHRAEYDWFRLYKPKKSEAMLDAISKRLASDLYGSMVSVEKAKTMILMAAPKEA